MARAVYYVVHNQGAWKIKYSDKYYGPFPTQKDAIKLAVNTAQQAGRDGHDAQVLVQGENSQFRTEWTYGKDPFPPRG